MLLLPKVHPGFPGKILLLAILVNCCLYMGHAQSNYTIIPFASRDALVSSEVMTIFQDSHHFLWIGHSGGVSRYDGYQFEDYLFTATKQLGKAYCIAEDTAQHLWIGTENGLFLYTEQAVEYISFGKNIRPVYALAFDTAGGLWIGTSDGPSYIPADTVQQTISNHQLNLSQFLLPAWKKYHPLGNTTVCLSLGNDGAAYFGDGYEVFRYWDEQITKVWKNAGHEDQLKSLIAVNKDTVYICSSLHGIQVVEKGNYRFSPADIGRSNALIEKDGSLFCYSTGGVYTINRFTLVADRLFEVPEYMQEWGTCVLLDNEKNFWIGTHEHVCYARQNFFTLVQDPKLPGFEELYAIHALQDGSLICGGNLGATFKATKGSAVFREWKKIFPRAQVTAVFQERQEEIWFSSWYQGIALYKNDAFTSFTKATGLRDNTNFIFLKNTRGELFAAGDDGVSKIIQDQHGKVHFRNYHFYTGSSDYAVINSGIPAPNGSLLFGSNRGLLILKNDTLLPATIKNAAHRNQNITDMCRDLVGNIWISTIGDGILVCSFQQGDTLVVQEQLTKQDGLPSLVYLRLLIDRDNIVWAAGYNGITRIERTRDHQFFISTYGKNQGFLPARFHTIKMMQDSTGIVWAATSSGLLKFDPAAIDHAMYPSMVLNDVTITDRDHVAVNGPLKSGVPAYL